MKAASRHPGNCSLGTLSPRERDSFQAEGGGSRVRARRCTSKHPSPPKLLALAGRVLKPVLGSIDDEFFPQRDHDIARLQFSPATCLDVTVDGHLPILNQQLRLPTRAGNTVQFQKLIEPDRIPFCLSCSQETSPSHAIHLNDNPTHRQIVHENGQQNECTRGGDENTPKFLKSTQHAQRIQ